MARIGYVRVSTTDQDLEIQLARLKAEECGIIRSEKVSGESREGRPELATVVAFLRPGDELVITRLDRRMLFDAAVSSGGIRADIDADGFLDAVATLCMSVIETRPERTLEHVVLLVDGLRHRAGF